jgi:acetyltransferase-like isoleucine patch superfamily enzyme
MNNFFRALNRGPIFRLTHAIVCWRRQRRFESWRRGDRRRASIARDLLLAGNLEPYPWISVGEGSEIQRNCLIWIDTDESTEPRLTIGKRVFIGQGSHLSVMRPMAIGDNCLIGAYCYLLTNNHRFDLRTVPIRDQDYVKKPLTLKEDVWVGAHSVLMPGITVGKGAIIGAGSVVTKSVGDYEIWGGVPAKKIGDRP